MARVKLCVIRFVRFSSKTDIYSDRRGWWRPIIISTSFTNTANVIEI